MTRIITPDEIKEQENRARILFWVLFSLLIVFVVGVMAFQFGWWGITPAKGTLYPPPTVTPTATPVTTPAPVIGGVSNESPEPQIDEVIDEVTKASVGSTYWTWLFASWAGASVFLLNMAAKRFYKIPDDPNTDFKRYLPWYFINFFRAPLLAMIVLWILTNINISLGTEGATGAAADFSKLPPIVLISIAFILGMYARVSQKQLDIITKAIFPKAWLMAEDNFTVTGPDTMLLKGKYNFRTDPASDVTWTASPGEIDPETGVYQAPESEDDAEKVVIVRASARSDPSRTNHKAVTLKLIQINGPAQAEPGKAISLSIQTNFTEKFPDEDLDKKISWSSSEGSFAPAVGKQTKFTVTNVVPPEKPPVIAIIKATLTEDDKTYTAELSIPVRVE